MARSAHSASKASPAPATAKAIGGFRPDLEGLRAIAVLAVVADHLVHYPTGGFAGVDIFFVLSGFLITGLLIREIKKTGRISFADFYRRRARRILPAALVVLVVTVCAAYLVFRTARATSVLEDAFWAAIFVSNWRSALTGTDYMQAGSAASPIQHYWSLGVEEQFYVFWPLLMLLVLWLAGKVFKARLRAQTIALGCVFAAAIVLSYTYSIIETSRQPAFSYFDTFGRAWELAAGALVALSMPAFARLPEAIRWLLGSVGLVVIVGSIFMLTPQSPFPGPWAAVPVAGALLMVIAGIGSAKHGYSHRFFPLSNPISRYIGKISFSLYLWHFPVIILIEPLLPRRAEFYPAALALMTVLSVLSFHMIEDPIRRSQWLSGRRSSKHLTGRRVRATTGSRLAKTRVSIAGVAVLALVALTVYSQFNTARSNAPVATQPSQVVPQVIPQSSPTGSASASPTQQVDPQIEQTALIKSALAAQQWPSDLVPSLDQFSNAGQAVKAPEWVKDGCLGTNESRIDDPIANAAHCEYGDPNGKHTLVVYGDSMDISYVPGLLRALNGQGWKVYVYTVAGCPVAAVNQTQIGGAAFPECDQFRDWAIGQIKKIKPDLVVLSEYRFDPVLISKATGLAADAERAAGYKSTLDRLAAVTDRLLLLSAPPEGQLIAQCATRFSSPKDCLAIPSSQYERNIAIEQKAIADVNANHPGMKATFAPTQQWFCYQNQCPAFIGTSVIHADQYHITAAGSEQIAPMLAEAMRQALAK